MDFYLIFVTDIVSKGREAEAIEDLYIVLVSIHEGIRQVGKSSIILVKAQEKVAKR